MTERQTIKYAPQWNNMTVDNVTFQTNNVVGNFNYPPNVPAYKPIIFFLLNCPLKKEFTNCPSVVYQNFLREFWSTAVAHDPFPSTDETEHAHSGNSSSKRIGQNYPQSELLGLNLSPEKLFSRSLENSVYFCDSGEIIYSDLVAKLLNKSRLKYVSYPRFISCALQVLLGSDYTQDENFRFLPGILMSPLPLAAKPKKGKSHTVTPTLPKSQGPEVPRALSKKSKRPKSKRPPTETKVTSPKPTKGSNQSHSVSSSTVPDPQDLKSDIQLASTGLPSTLDEGTRTTKTMPRPEGSLGDKDSGGNIPPANMEPVHPPVADLLGTGAKYQVDRTQSTRLRAFLLSDDKSEEDILRSGEKVDEEPQAVGIAETYHQKYDNTLLLTERQLVKYLRKMSQALFTKISKDNWEKHEEVAVNYVDLKASIDYYYDENIAHQYQTDKLVEASMSSLDKSSNTISDLYKGLNIITELLKEIKNVVKDDSVINKKITEATESFTKFFINITDLQSSVNTLQAYALKQDEELTAWAKSSTNMA
ncbi:hypothetical protein Tco_1218920 [Tanacetum coccineum]